MDKRSAFSELHKKISDRRLDNEYEKSKENCDIQQVHVDDKRNASPNSAVGQETATNFICRRNQSTGHQEPPFASQLGHLEKSIQFTPEMIRDQEMLVTMMSQRGMTETAIRRQFERLLDEQSRHLDLMNDARQSEKKSTSAKISKIEKKISKTEINEMLLPQKRCNYKYCSHNVSSNEPTCLVNQVNNDQEQIMHSSESAGEESSANNLNNQVPEHDSSRKLEPTSLLQIRQKRETLHGRNNGLQEPESALEIMRKCKYTYNDNCLSNVKFNGTQDKSDTQAFSTHKTVERIPVEKQLSANGLENKRHPSNPAVNFKSYQVRQSINEGYGAAYPPQKCQLQFSHTCPNTAYKYVNSSQENYQVAEKNSKSILQPTLEKQRENSSTLQPHKLEEKQILQEQCQKHSLDENYYFCPDFQEPKIIGGFTYFARKAQCNPKLARVSRDDYASIINSKSTTAF